MARYRVPAARASAELREKGSRFLAVVVPVGDEAAAEQALAALAREHRDASHLCWAWRLGPTARERSHDAGEPHGTAGVPILQVLRGRELADALVAVVRWFGGVKLGKGGLARAYAAAAAAALDVVPTTERLERRRLRLVLGYEQVGAVRRLLAPPQIELRRRALGRTGGAAARRRSRALRRGHGGSRRRSASRSSRRRHAATRLEPRLTAPVD